MEVESAILLLWRWVETLRREKKSEEINDLLQHGNLLKKLPKVLSKIGCTYVSFLFTAMFGLVDY